jgi:hypothetical protein
MSIKFFYAKIFFLFGKATIFATLLKEMISGGRVQNKYIPQ